MHGIKIIGFVTCFWCFLMLMWNSWWEGGIPQDHHLVFEGRVWFPRLLISQTSIYPYSSLYESSMPATITQVCYLFLIYFDCLRIRVIVVIWYTYIRLSITTRSNVSAIMPIKCDFLLWSRNICEPKGCIKENFVV